MRKLLKIFVVITMIMTMCYIASCNIFNNKKFGEFYSIREAYEDGLIQKEDLQIIANRHNNKQTLNLSDNDLIDKIKDSWAKKLRENCNDFRDIAGKDVVLSRFYGVYGNYYVVFLDYGTYTEEYVPVDLEIDGVIFHFGHPRFVSRLVVYENSN